MLFVFHQFKIITSLSVISDIPLSDWKEVALQPLITPTPCNRLRHLEITQSKYGNIYTSVIASHVAVSTAFDLNSHRRFLNESVQAITRLLLALHRLLHLQSCER